MIVAIGFDPHGCRLRRVLHGILQKIAYDAAHRLAIGFDENPSLDGRHLDVMTVRARLALIVVDAGADQFRKIDSFKPVLAPAGVHTPEVEKIFNELVEPRGFLPKDCEVLAPAGFIVNPPFGQQFCELTERRQRTSEFVRHGRHEV